MQKSIFEAQRSLVLALAQAGAWDEIKSKAHETQFRMAVDALINERVMFDANEKNLSENDANRSISFDKWVTSLADNPEFARVIGFAVKSGFTAIGNTEENYSPPRLLEYASILSKHPNLDWISAEFVTSYAEYLVQNGRVLT